MPRFGFRRDHNHQSRRNEQICHCVSYSGVCRVFSVQCTHTGAEESSTIFEARCRQRKLFFNLSCPGGLITEEYYCSRYDSVASCMRYVPSGFFLTSDCPVSTLYTSLYRVLCIRKGSILHVRLREVYRTYRTTEKMRRTSTFPIPAINIVLDSVVIDEIWGLKCE